MSSITFILIRQYRISCYSGLSVNQHFLFSQGFLLSSSTRSSACRLWRPTPSGPPSASPPPSSAYGPRPRPCTVSCSTTWVCLWDPWATRSRRLPVLRRRPGRRPPASTLSGCWTGGSAQDLPAAVLRPPPSTTTRRRRRLLLSRTVYNTHSPSTCYTTTSKYNVNNTSKLVKYIPLNNIFKTLTCLFNLTQTFWAQ